jgi:hypothetical protein
MKTFCGKIFNQIDLQLANILPMMEEDPIQNCYHAIHILLEGFEKLRTTFLNQEISQEEEIDFFKNDKPQLTSQIIYFNELCSIECNKPIASEKTIRKYYTNQFKKLELFFIDNAEFYSYYRKGNTYFDAIYFLRNQNNDKFMMDGFNFQIDKSFATSHDYKVAQILAYQKVQSYLSDKLKKPLASKSITHDKVLKWTGSKVGIVELIYALHTEGVFNHGAAEIKDIVQGFSRVFDVELGQFHRTFYEITNRKSERTKFISVLKENLLKRMDQIDEFKRLP